MSRQVLITGVAGFIGSNLADILLRHGVRLIGVDDLSYGQRDYVPAAVEFHQMDVGSPDMLPLLRGVDCVFHLAAKNCLSDCQDDPVAAARINVAGTVNVLHAAHLAGVRKVVLASSSAVYEGSRLLPTPETESAPSTAYALSKTAADLWAGGYQRAYGLNLTTLRYFCVYGPRQDFHRSRPPVMSAFALALLRGRRPVIYGTGDQRRDFIHVDDINRFHLKCLEDARTDGRIFNLGSGRSWSVRQILAITQDLLHTSVDPEFQAGDEERVLETRADIAAAAALGWQPEVMLEQGLQGMIDWLRAHALTPTAGARA